MIISQQNVLLHRVNFILKKYMNTKRTHLQWWSEHGELAFCLSECKSQLQHLTSLTFDKLLTICILFFKIKMKTMLHGCLELVLILNTAPG